MVTRKRPESDWTPLPGTLRRSGHERSREAANLAAQHGRRVGAWVA